MTGRGWKEGDINYNSITRFNDLFEGCLALGGNITFFILFFHVGKGQNFETRPISVTFGTGEADEETTRPYKRNKCR